MALKEAQWEKYASVKCAFCGVLLRFEEAKLGPDGRFYCESCDEDMHRTGHKRDYSKRVTRWHAWYKMQEKAS